MTPHLSLSQLTFLVGTALAIGVVLVVIFLGLHKTFERQRQGAKLRSTTPRAEDAAAFGLAALQGVIAGLKEQQQELEQLCRAAELRAQTTARTMETIVQEMDQAVIVFDHDGFLSLANPAARALLGIDTWSRRRYSEPLGPDSELAGFVRACLEAGTSARQERIEHHTLRGEVRSLAILVLPVRSSTGEVEGGSAYFEKLLTPRPSDSRRIL